MKWEVVTRTRLVKRTTIAAGHHLGLGLRHLREDVKRDREKVDAVDLILMIVEEVVLDK